MFTPNQMRNLVKYSAIGAKSYIINAFRPGYGKKYLLKEISKIPGLPARFGQLLSYRLNEGDSNEDDTPAPAELPWVKSQIEKELPKLAKDLEWISPHSTTASLGQVHHALLKNGQEIAIKIQFPRIDRELHEQLDLLLHGLTKVPKSQMNAHKYRTFLSSFITEELDYLHELEIQSQFQQLALKGIVVPKVYPEYSCRTLLTQSFESAQTPQSLKTESLEIREKIASQLSYFFLSGIFTTGLVHADLHPKNWGYRVQSGELVIYDYGGSLKIDPEVRKTLLRLLFDAPTNAQLALTALVELGFDRDKLAPIENKLDSLCAAIASPFSAQDQWNPRTWHLDALIEQALGPEKWSFRAAGPPWFLILMRSVSGWIQSLRILDCGVDLRGLGLLFPQSLASPSSSAEPISKPSRVLKVSVKERDQEVVALEMPARVIHDLESLLPEQAASAVKMSGLSLSQIRSRALASGLDPQELFSLKTGDKHYRVWIE